MKRLDESEEIVIRARVRGAGRHFSDIAKARFMFWNLVRSSALLPYKDITFGVFWTFVRPLIFVAVIVFIRNKSYARMGETIPYPLFVFSGLIFWWYFADAARQSGRSLYTYRGLLTKIFYPRVITPVVPVVSRLFDLGLQLLAITPIMLYFDVAPGWNIFLLPLVVVHIALLATGLGFLFAVLGAAMRDFERILDFILYLAFFVSPVMYSVRIVPDAYRDLYAVLNPMAGPLEMVRFYLTAGLVPEYRMWLLSGLSTLCIAIIGMAVFHVNEEKLAEMVS